MTTSLLHCEGVGRYLVNICQLTFLLKTLFLSFSYLELIYTYVDLFTTCFTMEDSKERRYALLDDGFGVGRSAHVTTVIELCTFLPCIGFGNRQAPPFFCYCQNRPEPGRSRLVFRAFRFLRLRGLDLNVLSGVSFCPSLLRYTRGQVKGWHGHDLVIRPARDWTVCLGR